MDETMGRIPSAHAYAKEATRLLRRARFSRDKEPLVREALRQLEAAKAIAASAVRPE